MDATTTASITPPASSPYSRKNPYLAELTRHDRLTLPGSEKDTRHFVINLGDSGLTYTPGDSLGTFARNAPQIVDEVIRLLGLPPETGVKSNQSPPSNLRESLLQNYILNRANRKIMSAMAERIPQGEQRNRLMEIVDNGDVLNEYLYSRENVDVLKDFYEARF